jgi:uncharacterized protein (UPF0332 family)
VTDENARQAIAEELSRAAQAWSAADLLRQHGLFQDAVSRLYYFTLYHVRAALISVGHEPRSHAGALRLFGLHLVRQGRLPAADAHLFSKLMKYREEADYNPSHPFSAEDLAAMLQEARQLADRVVKLLEDAGYLSNG